MHGRFIPYTYDAAGAMESHEKECHCMVKIMQYTRYTDTQVNTVLVACNVTRSATYAGK